MNIKYKVFSYENKRYKNKRQEKISNVLIYFIDLLRKLVFKILAFLMNIPKRKVLAKENKASFNQSRRLMTASGATFPNHRVFCTQYVLQEIPMKRWTKEVKTVQYFV